MAQVSPLIFELIMYSFSVKQYSQKVENQPMTETQDHIFQNSFSSMLLYKHSGSSTMFFQVLLLDSGCEEKTLTVFLLLQKTVIISHDSA